MNTSTWFVLKTKPKQEQRAKQNLENRAALTYLPMLSRERNRRVMASEPLFPGYILGQFPGDEPSMHQVRSTFGALNFVRLGHSLAHKLTKNE